MRAIAPFALLAAAATTGAEGPENAVLIVDPASREAMHVANYYKHARNIPDRNVLYMHPGAADLAEFAGPNVDALLGTLFNRHLHNHADVVVIPPGSPFYVHAPGYITDNCSPVTRLSISSAYASAFNMDLILDGVPHNLPVGYYTGFGDPVAFDSNVFWFGGEPSDSQFAKRYFIGAMLGETGPNGNSVEEILDMIDRSVAADATHPDGTFYFMNNTNDPARNVRNTQFPATIDALTNAGHDADQIDAQKLPLGHHDCLGVLSGFANANIEGGNFTLIDGAFADHLTSFAATLDNANQSKVSEWIRKGASASAGTVEEPCNYPLKFNLARFHYYYAEGLSIGEAYLRSLGYGPFQNLLYGDPLTRAHTHVPEVQIPDAPADPVSGMLTLTPDATTSDPDADIDTLTLYIDGAPRDTIDPGDAFEIDTTTLDDGVHEIRVVAADDTPVRARGNAVIDVEVDNAGGALPLAASASSGNLATLFTFTIDSFEGRDVTHVDLLQNARVVASADTDAAPAEISVYGRTLGGGPVTLQARANTAAGDTVTTNRVTLDIDPFGELGGGVPVAFGHTIRVLEDQPFLVELPATYDDMLGAAEYEILDPPEHATVYENTTGAFRVMVADAQGATNDAFTFQVTTPGGTSNAATINIVYELNGCNADVNDDGQLDILDFVTFQALFQAGDDNADANHDGLLNVLDFVAFQQVFKAGCR